MSENNWAWENVRLCVAIIRVQRRTLPHVTKEHNPYWLPLQRLLRCMVVFETRSDLLHDVIEMVVISPLFRATYEPALDPPAYYVEFDYDSDGSPYQAYLKGVHSGEEIRLEDPKVKEQLQEKIPKRKLLMKTGG